MTRLIPYISSTTDSSDEEVATPPSSATSGPPPPPLRGIPHVKPDSHFIPPRQMTKPLPKAWRPSSGHSQHHEHSLASSSQVSSAVSSWSEAATSSSVKPTPAPSRPPLPPSLHVLRPPLPLHGSIQSVRSVRPLHVQPVRLPQPILSLQPARPLFPQPVIRPHLPSQEPIPTRQSPATIPPPLLTSTSETPGGQPFPTLDLPLPAPSHSHPSTPGSLTPNPGSPALTPSPSPLLPRTPPHSALTTPPSQLPPRYLPPISTNTSPLDLPSGPPPHRIADGNMTSSSSSLTLTDSDLSQEARDTFDPGNISLLAII